MKSSRIFICFTIMVLVNTVNAFAYDFCNTIDGVNIYFTLTSSYPDRTVRIAASPANDYKGDFKIPTHATYPGIETPFPVVGIDEGAFKKCKDLIGITFIEGITEIPKDAFYECESLKSVELPSSLTTIGLNAFFNCSTLEEIELPSSLTTIGSNAFYNCSSLEEIELPSSLTTIGLNAFFNCSTLEEIEIPSSVTTIGSYAFYNCSNLKDVIFNEGLTTISVNAFQLCTNLESIVLPNSLSSIGSYAFQYCNSLKTIDVPNSVTTIGKMAFSFCDNLTAVRFPQNSQFTSIPYCCCYYNSQETQKNASLEAVILPANITDLGDFAFSGCTSLKYIFCESNSLSYQTKSFENVPETCTLIVPQNFSTKIKFPKAYGTGIILDKNTTEVNLSDNTYFYNFIGEETDIENTTYTRTFQAGNFYLPLFLPFSMSVSDINSSLGSSCNISQLKGINYNDGTIILNWLPVESGQLNANTPYIVKLESQASQIEATNVTFAKDRITVNGYFEDNGCTLTLTGVYLPEQLTKGDGKYVLTKNNSFQQAGANLTLNPYRFYLTFTTPTGQAKIKMNVDGEENQDALESIFYIEGEGDNIYYDLNGRRVENPSNGIFITNGKKVLF